ncbi:hypothetical protein FCV25MIE_19247 [Fagus crenata]
MPFALLFIIRCMLFTTLWLLWFARNEVRVGVKRAEAVHLARQAAELTEEFLEIQHSGAVGNQLTAGVIGDQAKTLAVLIKPWIFAEGVVVQNIIIDDSLTFEA